MKTLYEKNQLTFALVWIVVYCVLQSLANPLNKAIGVEYAASAGFCILQALALFAFIRKNGLLKRYGLCKSPVPARRFLCYLPLVVLASGNLWNGAALHYAPAETVCRIVCMLCVGFLEEVIFRGLLFVAIARDNVKSAVIISSVTFGIGHIINLFNGSGMDLVSNLCQIVFAIAVGFLLVTIFYRGGSLIPCILAHSAINTLGTFANDASLPTETRLLHLGILIVIAVVYTLILTRTLPEAEAGHSHAPASGGGHPAGAHSEGIHRRADGYGRNMSDLWEERLPYALPALLVLAVFYGIYFAKVLAQKRRGIRTRQIGRRKEKSIHTVEVLMSIATLGAPMAQLMSIAFGWSHLPANARFTGFLMGLLGGGIFLLSVLCMKDSWRAGIPDKDRTELVTTGIYRYSRNPAFLGFDLMYAGVLLLYGNLLTLGFSVFAMVMLHLQILQEERYLVHAFGAPYQAYCRQVFRYLGRK